MIKKTLNIQLSEVFKKELGLSVYIGDDFAGATDLSTKKETIKAITNIIEAWFKNKIEPAKMRIRKQ